MNRILLALLLFVSASRAIDTLTVPTDYLTVTSGTRATLAGNFTAMQTWGNKVRDSLAPVTARLSGYTGKLAIASLSDLRLKLDADNTETARLLVESGTGDSLFTVREDTTARFYKHLTVDSNLTVNRKLIVADSVRLTQLTASLPMVTNANKQVISATVTGTGNTIAMSAGPTFTGTLAAANGTYSGTLGVTGVTTLTAQPIFSSLTASLPIFTDGSKGAVSNAMTGTGSVVMSASPTLTGTIAAANQTLSGTLGVTGAATFTAAPVFSSVTASQILSVDGSKNLTSIAKTGTGSVMLATSPTTTGKLTADTISATSIALGGNEYFDYDEGTFTATLSGVTASVTGTARYTRIGKSVILFIPSLTGTSNSTACTITGLPAAIQPARGQNVYVGDLVDNTTSYCSGLALVNGSTITLSLKNSFTGAPSATFTNTNVKGWNTDQTISYTLQ